MSENQYENFKQGIKNDITNLASSLFLMGGLFLLVLAMLGGLYVAIKADRMDTSLRYLIGSGVTTLGGVMIFNRKALYLILVVWLILIVAAITLPVIFFIGYIFYYIFKQPYYHDSN